MNATMLPPVLVTDIVASINSKIDQGTLFTAYDITRDLRDSFWVEHYEVQTTIDALCSEGEFGPRLIDPNDPNSASTVGYKRTLLHVGAPRPAFVYGPSDVDAKSYSGGTMAPTDSQVAPLKAPVVAVDEDEDDATSASGGVSVSVSNGVASLPPTRRTFGNRVDVDTHHRIMLPKGPLVDLGAKAGDSVNVSITEDGVIEVSMNTLVLSGNGTLKRVKIDQYGNAKVVLPRDVNVESYVMSYVMSSQDAGSDANLIFTPIR